MAFTRTAGVVYAEPNLTFSTTNSSGTSNALRADDTIALFDAVNPALVAIGTTSSSPGSSGTGARRDHVHGIDPLTSNDPTDISLVTTAASPGSSSSLTREDHTHGTRPAYFWKSCL